MKKAETESTVVRPVAESDVNAVVALVQELAPYEQASDQCHLTPAQLRTALFGEEPALFGHVAEVSCEVVAFALWFRNFSTWDGVHGIYLEDLFVRSKHQGCGLGRALLAELAAECVHRGYSRLQWWELDWNGPAIGFSRSIGAEPMDEWTLYRITGRTLTALASDR
jgi:GNAT superfamily N-acetyltransferase